MSAAADDLRAARALIEQPETWTQGALARYPDGAAAACTSQPGGSAKLPVGTPLASRSFLS